MFVREATESDIEQVMEIYNQGIEDRIATLETDLKDRTYMKEWFASRQNRYFVLVAEEAGAVVGWASVNPYNNRCAYRGVGDLSIYIRRGQRGKGVGQKLLQALEEEARKREFYKLVLFTFPFNALGQGLYRKSGYREVGVFQNQGILDEKFVDVMAMEKIL